MIIEGQKVIQKVTLRKLIKKQLGRKILNKEWNDANSVHL